MKKISLMFLALMMIVCLFGCGQNGDAPEGDGQENQQIEQQPKATVFEQFEAGLTNDGLTYEKVTMAAEYVGAEEGYKYMMDSGNVELYRFDEDSDAFKEVSENKSVKLEGFGSFPVELNGNMALLINDVTDPENIMGIFNGIE